MVGPRLRCLAAAGVPAGNDPVTAQHGSQRRRCCPPVHAAHGLLWASLSGCGRASVRLRLHVDPGFGGAIHS